MTETTTQPAARIIASLLTKHGIKDVVVSPGSRNVPLIIAIAREMGLKTYSVADERTAGFIALGMSARKGHPVVLVCTSGTALLNYTPAVAEAYYRNIPLIVISADRPAQWIDQDDSQTLHQSHALSGIVRQSFDVPSDYKYEDFEWYVNRIINQAFLVATGIPRGPVHINVHFDTPLGKTEPRAEHLSFFETRAIRSVSPIAHMSRNDIQSVSQELLDRKILIVVGTHTPDARLTKALKIIANNPNITIVSEVQSNIPGVKSITLADLILATVSDDEGRNLVPDYLFTIGASVVSKNLKQWLRNARGYRHWYLGKMRSGELVDCYQHLTDIIDVDVPSFLSSVAGFLRRYGKTHSDYASRWQQAQEKVKRVMERYIEMCEWSDLKAIYHLVSYLPGYVNLQLSNGMTVRYAQLSPYRHVHRVDSNRGCSGIDGSTSTAVGAAIDFSRPTVLITGDMSARYDLGGLAEASLAPNLVIFVLNNSGGDIFRIINQTRTLPELESLIALNRDMTFSQYAGAFGLDYRYIDNIIALKQVCCSIKEPRHKPLLCEIDTRSADNSEIYRKLFNLLKDRNI